MRDDIKFDKKRSAEEGSRGKSRGIIKTKGVSDVIDTFTEGSVSLDGKIGL